MKDQAAIKRAYSKVYYATAVFHLIFVWIYIRINCPLLAGYNGLSTLLYLFLGFKAKNTEHLKYLFIACFWEILLFSILSYILLGWNSGFMLYIVGILPLLFYSVYLFQGLNIRATFGYLTGMLSAFYATMLLCFSEKLQVYHISATVERVFYTMNISSTFLLLISFLILFFSKMNMAQQELQTAVSAYPQPLQSAAVFTSPAQPSTP